MSRDLFYLKTAHLLIAMGLTYIHSMAANVRRSERFLIASVANVCECRSRDAAQFVALRRICRFVELAIHLNSETFHGGEFHGK